MSLKKIADLCYFLKLDFDNLVFGSVWDGAIDPQMVDRYPVFVVETHWFITLVPCENFVVVL